VGGAIAARQIGHAAERRGAVFVGAAGGADRPVLTTPRERPQPQHQGETFHPTTVAYNPPMLRSVTVLSLLLLCARAQAPDPPPDDWSPCGRSLPPEDE